MAFSDPQTITVDATPETLNRISSDGTKSVYSTTDESIKMTISHQESKKRTRHLVRIDHRVVAADPLSSENEWKNLGVYFVIDEPEYGFTDAVVDNIAQALTAWLSTANVTKVLSLQH